MQYCMLCRNSELSLISEFSVTDLAALYTRYYGIDVVGEFRGVDHVAYLECGNCGLRFFDPPSAGSPLYYDKLVARSSASYYAEGKDEYAFASTLISDNDTVLDVGAGAGNFAKYVKGVYVGLDFNPFAINLAKEQNVNVISDSLDSHAKENPERYSVVTCFQVMEHIPEPHYFIESCLRTLRPGGLFIVSVPSEDSWVPMQENSILNMPPHHVSRWTDMCLTHLSDLFGIELLRLEHEELSKAHVEPFCLAMSQRLVRSLLGLKSNKLIDLSLKAKAVAIISHWLVPKFKTSLSPSEIHPRGHSVTAVYRKKI